MSAVPLELLYQLTSRDAQGTLWRPFFYDSGLIASNDSPHIRTMPFIAADQVVFVTRFTVTALTTAVRITQGVLVTISDDSGNPVTAPYVGSPLVPLPAAGDNLFINENVDLMLIGGVHQITATISWDAGAAGNTTRFTVIGYQVPRGNVALP